MTGPAAPGRAWSLDFTTDLAWFVVELGLTPDGYWSLDLEQRNSIVREFRRAQAARRR